VEQLWFHFQRNAHCSIRLVGSPAPASPLLQTRLMLRCHQPCWAPPMQLAKLMAPASMLLQTRLMLRCYSPLTAEPLRP
jgi:hypothetical protein